MPKKTTRCEDILCRHIKPGPSCFAQRVWGGIFDIGFSKKPLDSGINMVFCESERPFCKVFSTLEYISDDAGFWNGSTFGGLRGWELEGALANTRPIEGREQNFT